MERTVYIYALCDPDTGEARYVGRTVNLARRYQEHLSGGTNPVRTDWVQELLETGAAPKQTTLEETDEEHASEREQYWIQHLLEAGHNLTNIMGGIVPHRYARFDRQMTFCISPELAAKLDDASRRTRQTKTTLIVTALNLLLDMPKEQASKEIARYVMQDS